LKYKDMGDNIEWFQAYDLWKEDEGMELIDPSLDDSCSSCKLMRCLQVALLCVQENPVDRPTMLEVYSMLKNDIGSITTPQKPAFSAKRDKGAGTASTSTSQQRSCSVSDTPISEIIPRWPGWLFGEMVYLRGILSFSFFLFSLFSFTSVFIVFRQYVVLT
jgi:hypothetical protein